MKKNTTLNVAFMLAFCIVSLSVNSTLYAQDKPATVTITWDKTIKISKTTPTLQLVQNPLVQKKSAIQEQIFKNLKNLGADYVRYVPWFPYQKMAVAELKPPAGGKTFWDFTYIDNTMQDVMEATKGHSVVINFSTTPAWMWKTKSPVTYPGDPYQVSWDYNQGTELRDPTMKELTGYYARLLSWYTRGGFTDELGHFHKSGHFYKIAYWEVLNEPDLEHSISPQLYTKMYDAIVLSLKKVAPGLKFVGISNAFESNPEYYEYFLNPAHHKKGVTLDCISYHHYSTPSYNNQPVEGYQYPFFEKADAFLDNVRYIEAIRKRLAPHVVTMINEIGTIISPSAPDLIEPAYWNASGAMYAHIFLELTKMGVDVAGESQLVGYPTQFPDVSMVNWENGNPNARYWILKLIKDNFGPGDKLVGTSLGGVNADGQAIITGKGKKILFINKQNKEIQIVLPAGNTYGLLHYVDPVTAENPPAQVQVGNNKIITLKPFAVAVVDVN
jgi:hypothetical protein